MRETDRTKPALALSGGGFRATLFHCGALLRLNEIGLLRQIERIGSVSGGSIAAGRLAVTWDRLSFDNDGRAANLSELVIKPLRSFCERGIDRAAIVGGVLMPGRTIGDKLAALYDKYLLEGRCLHDIPDFPQFVFKATNLQTGRMVRLSKRRIADYRIGEIPFPKNIRLATAVAASSAFPPVLSPIRIKTDPDDWSDLPGTDSFGDLAYSSELVLTDGGAYDNMGLETVDSFATILVSDAGAPFAYDRRQSTPWNRQLKRVLDIATDQSRGVRKRLLHAEAKTEGRRFAYWGIDQDWPRSTMPGALPVSLERTRRLAHIRTRLNTFSRQEQGELINWGYAACDNAVRRYVSPTAAPPAGWPDPDFPLD